MSDRQSSRRESAVAPTRLWSVTAETTRACTACRRSKKRCDRAQAPDRICSFCVVNGFRCLVSDKANDGIEKLPHVKALEVRVRQMEALLERLKLAGQIPAKDGPTEKLHTKALETRVQQMEKLMSKFIPDHDGGANPVRHESNKLPGKTMLAPSQDVNRGGRLTQTELLSRLARLPGGIDYQGSVELLRAQEKDFPGCPRFLGESSHRQLAQIAMEARSLNGPAIQTASTATSRRPQYWRCLSVDEYNKSLGQDMSRARQYTFPDDDLIPVLVDLYFANVNLFWPLLHRPTFDLSVAVGLHLRDDGFATVLMLVCAAGARFSGDPRVLTDPEKPDSAGWRWFRQTSVLEDSFAAGPSLYALQAILITSGFLRFTSAVQTAWTATGIGLRMAQASGAHRRAAYGAKPNARDELWKRAWWLLAGCDRSLAIDLGRSCAVQVEDYDLDLPTECDDEYWTNENPDLAFVQPPGKPSLVAFFVKVAQLDRITGAVLRNLYSIRKTGTILTSIRQPSDREVVADLDSALNEWMNDMPEHLRWDPQCADERFFKQSVLLHSIYNCARITIHRNFIPTPRHQPSISLPSLAICTHAASSVAHMLDVLVRRCGGPVLQLSKEAFVAGAVLILALWGGKRSGTVLDPSKYMEDANKCLNYLTLCESRMYNAGRLADLLRELLYIGERPSKNHKDDGLKTPGAPSSETPLRATETISIINGDGLSIVVEVPKTPEEGPTNPVKSRRRVERQASQPTIEPSPVRDGQNGLAASPQTQAADQTVPAPGSDSSSSDSHASPATNFDPWTDTHVEKSLSQTDTLGPDMDPFALWSALPAGNEPDEWVAYIESLSTLSTMHEL